MSWCGDRRCQDRRLGGGRRSGDVCDANQIRPQAQVTLANKLSDNDCCTIVTG